MDNSKIMVAVPTRGMPRVTTVVGLSDVRDHAPGLPPIHYEENRMSACDGRNRIVKRFLESKCEYLIMVDDDIGPSRDLLRLASHEKDIVAAPVMIVRPDNLTPFPNIYGDYWPEKDVFRMLPNSMIHVETGTFLEVGAAGTGTICIHRRVLEHSDLKPAFEHRWDKDGVIDMTEDMYFSIRAKKAGFKIHADFSVLCDQVVNVFILDIMHRYMEAFRRAMPAMQESSTKRERPLIILPGEDW